MAPSARSWRSTARPTAQTAPGRRSIQIVTTSSPPSSATPCTTRSANRAGFLPLCCIGDPFLAEPLAKQESRRQASRRAYDRPMTDADQTVEAARSLVADRIAPAVREWERASVYPRDVAEQSELTALFVPAGAGGLG